MQVTNLVKIWKDTEAKVISELSEKSHLIKNNDDVISIALPIFINGIHDIGTAIDTGFNLNDHLEVGIVFLDPTDFGSFDLKTLALSSLGETIQNVIFNEEEVVNEHSN